MFRRTVLWGALIAACPLVAVADGHADIIAAQAAWEATLNGDDTSAIAAHFMPDARLLPQDGAIVQGTEAIVAFWSGFVSGPAQIDLQMIDVDMIGDTAIEIGSYVLTIPAEDGTETVLTGKTLVVWKNDGGTWRMSQDMWNDGL